MGNRHRAGNPRAALDALEDFSGASTAFGAAPNTQACAMDIALPGVLPVLNRGRGGEGDALRARGRRAPSTGARFSRARTTSIRICRRATRSASTRCRSSQGGTSTSCSATSTKTVRLTRAHLEEDAGKSLHEDFHGMTGIDLNRAGTPLLEIVSEPDMRSAAEAVAYAQGAARAGALARHLRRQHAGRLFRCDANVRCAPRVGQARHALRDQEPQLLPLPRAGDRVRGAAPDRDPGGRRHDPPGDAAVRSGPRRDRPCAARRTRTTTAISPIPICCRSRSAPIGWARSRRSMPELPQAKRDRFVAEFGLTPTTPSC